ncbi:MAG: hypothetical protein ACP5HQ_06750 [Thermoprotei archaeon]
MKGILVLILIAILGVAAYWTGLFGLLGGKTVFAKVYNETIQLTSSAPATVYKQISLPAPGTVNLTVVSHNPVEVQVINGTKTIDLGKGMRVSNVMYLSQNFTLVVKGLNSTATVYVVENY